MLLTGFFKGFMVCNNFAVLICYICHVEMQLHDVIKLVGIKLTDTNTIPLNSTDTDTSTYQYRCITTSYVIYE